MVTAAGRAWVVGDDVDGIGQAARHAWPGATDCAAGDPRTHVESGRGVTLIGAGDLRPASARIDGTRSPRQVPDGINSNRPAPSTMR